MNMRKITSLTAFISFILLMLTSIVLYMVPSGRVANWAGWTYAGLEKGDWEALHVNLGVLFLVSVILHTWYNWAAIVAYLSSPARKVRIFTPDCIVALLVTIVVAGGTLAGLPPMSTIVDFGDTLSTRADLAYGEPPYGHAEYSTLTDYAEKVRIDLDTVLAALTAAGITFSSAEETLGQVAVNNKSTPQILHAIVIAAVGKTLEPGVMPEEPPAGLGSRTLAVLSESYGLEIVQVIRILEQEGIVAAPNERMRDIAANNNMDPHGIYRLIYTATRNQ